MAAPVDVASVTPAPVEAVTTAPPPASAPPRHRRWVGRSSWPAWATLLTVVGVTVIAMSQLHPSLLFANTTTAGGDTGAHVALPAFIKSNLINHGQLTGWDPGWYDGFPLYTYYFILPDLVAALLSYIVPYALAFKWIT